MDLYIGRLRLNAPASAGADAERLSRLVADGLAGAPGPARRVESMQAGVEAPPETVTEALSRRIVEEILRQLERMI